MPDETDEVTLERVTVTREFPIEQVEEGDGRNLHVRIVPYNTVARVADPPRFEPYDESWLPGVFHRQTKAADKVKLLVNVEHEQGIRGVVGHGTELDDRDDALYGHFRVHPTAVGETALELVRENILDGVSLEAIVMRSRRDDESGVVERVRAHLDKVSLCRMAAYKDAMVLAVRSDASNGELDDANEVIDLSAKPVDLAPATNPAVDAALEAVGWTPIARTAIVAAPFDKDQERFTEDEWERACLIRHGDGDPKERCKLPVLEPNGDINSHAVQAVARDLLGGRVPLTPVEKGMVARKLVRLHRTAGLQLPNGLLQVATRS